MPKFAGPVGYASQVEVKPGVWKEQITEVNYYGDVLSSNRRLVTNADLNDDLSVSNQISIMADAYALNNFFAIRYVVWGGGVKWKVTNVVDQRPRLILTLGGVYNG